MNRKVHSGVFGIYNVVVHKKIFKYFGWEVVVTEMLFGSARENTSLLVMVVKGNGTFKLTNLKLRNLTFISYFPFLHRLYLERK